ncbi:MAG: hypothetical protein P1U89_20140 [Verrucomicrobiales bacterium]|nr:hypothetical protein [Verrucomicrobiales bacterium]
MRKVFLYTSLAFTAISLFIQYRSISFAISIVELIREFGQALAKGEQSDQIRDFFFYQAEEIRVFAQDSFIAQQISLALLAFSIIFMIIAMLMEKPAVSDKTEK